MRPVEDRLVHSSSYQLGWLQGSVASLIEAGVIAMWLDGDTWWIGRQAFGEKAPLTADHAESINKTLGERRELAS